MRLQKTMTETTKYNLQDSVVVVVSWNKSLLLKYAIMISYYK